MVVYWDTLYLRVAVGHVIKIIFGLALSWSEDVWNHPFLHFSEGTTSVSVVYLEVLLIMIIWQEKFIDYWLWPYPLPCLDFRLCSLSCSPLLLPPHYIFFPVLVHLAAAALYHYPALSYISEMLVTGKKTKKQNKWIKAKWIISDAFQHSWTLEEFSNLFDYLCSDSHA